LLVAGSETSSSTIEWTMSLLLNHPKELERARAELDRNIGQNRLVEEEDLPKLPYLQSIIYESQRLHPAAPILLPLESSSDCTIGNYTIPSKTILMVNAWAIHRDPQLWDDPESFKPERFLGLENDAYKHKFIPFGLGRRKCPGAGLANRVVGLTLGSLIQCFEWERISNELVDLSEGTGITMPKASPLEAICKPPTQCITIHQCFENQTGRLNWEPVMASVRFYTTIDFVRKSIKTTMEQNFFSNVSLLFFLLFSLTLSLLLFHKQRQRKTLPPSPPSLPIVGHLHLAKQPLHKILKHLSDKYGPIFSLRFGNQLVVVISSPATVEKCFKKNNIIFANRPQSLVY
ncbi:unnamed protein product, partial [Coffea canephora]